MFWLIYLFFLLLIIGVSFIGYAIKTIPTTEQPSNKKGDESFMWFGYGLYFLIACALVFAVVAFTFIYKIMGWNWF